MKNLVILLAVASAIALSCNSVNKSQLKGIDTLKTDTLKTDTSSASHVVGGDKDAHGCLSSAGYTWSVLKNDCIRVWETGIRLDQIEKNEGHTSMASVIIADDGKRAELFIANEKASVLLDQQSGADVGSYSANGYTLKKSGAKWLLSKDGKDIYKN
uniref:hypothetical protein n=1 Tax=Pedobacter schmidteae TaxID=2201271 RepID=UPI000EB00F3F|nr:hypothetical protein [Pedobacter schmidteae]